MCHNEAGQLNEMNMQDQCHGAEAQPQVMGHSPTPVLNIPIGEKLMPKKETLNRANAEMLRRTLSEQISKLEDEAELLELSRPLQELMKRKGLGLDHMVGVNIESVTIGLRITQVNF